VDVVEKFTKSRVTFDIPYKNLGFTGSPHNNNVLLVPTVNCLVHLTHQPFLVVSLQEIEVGFLERVGFMIKNFDLVLIYKDYSRPITFINAIPIQFKDQIKTWLDSSDLLFFESQTNYKWEKLLKRFRMDPELFVVTEGGWSAFADDSDEEQNDENGEGDSENGGGDSAFTLDEDGEEEGDLTESEYTDDDFADDDEEGGDEVGEGNLFNFF
jgi:nucleosome binding factor SPN SPT16 subunit